MKPITTLADVAALRVDPSARLFSATHQEIASFATTDVYFIKTLEVLQARGLEGRRATAEIFPRREGVLCGLPECVRLLEGRGVSVWALPEGEPFAAGEPVMRIEGPYGSYGPLETALLGILASSSAWATAARQAKEAAGKKPVFCFGARHVHPAVAPVLERAAVIGGMDGAACVLGAKLAGAEPVGTVPHALFLLVGDTVEAARLFHQVMPPDSPRTILVDTFKDEAEESLRVAAALGSALQGVRLDTPGERGGVTPDLVREVRARLDQAGHRHVRIFVSGGLTPERIRLLAEAGADAFGVGSFVSSAPPIDMTMDLKEVEGRPVAKRGRIPGPSPTERLARVV